MDTTATPLGPRGVALAALGVAAATVALALALGAGYGSQLLLVALSVPVLLVLVPLFYIGTRVASRADDPEEVERRLAESLGMSPAEFDRRREGKRRHAHPAEREFDEE